VQHVEDGITKAALDISWGKAWRFLKITILSVRIATQQA
jgi:hypothetical protein